MTLIFQVISFKYLFLFITIEHRIEFGSKNFEIIALIYLLFQIHWAGRMNTRIFLGMTMARQRKHNEQTVVLPYEWPSLIPYEGHTSSSPKLLALQGQLSLPPFQGG